MFCAENYDQLQILASNVMQKREVEHRDLNL